MEKDGSNPWGKVSWDRSLSEDDWPLPRLPVPGEKKKGGRKVTSQNADSNNSQVEATDNIISSARSDSVAESDLQQQSDSMEQNSDLQSEPRDHNREIISSAAQVEVQVEVDEIGGEPISSQVQHNPTANTQGYQVSVEVAQSILNPRSDLQHLSFFSGSMDQTSALQSHNPTPQEEENLGGTVPSPIAQILTWVDPYPQRR